MPHACALSDRVAFVRNCYRWKLGTSNEETAALVVVARTKEWTHHYLWDKDIEDAKKNAQYFCVCSQSSPRLLGRSNHYTLADQNCYLWYEIFIGFSAACVRLTKTDYLQCTIFIGFSAACVRLTKTDYLQCAIFIGFSTACVRSESGVWMEQVWNLHNTVRHLTVTPQSVCSGSNSSYMQ